MSIDIPLNWNLPKIKVGDEIRFLYFESDMKECRGFRGIVTDIRYLSHEPLTPEIKEKNKIKRGSCYYTIHSLNNKKDIFARSVFTDLSGIKNKTVRTTNHYNQRMANVEIIK